MVEAVTTQRRDEREKEEIEKGQRRVYYDEISKLQQTHFREAGTHGKEHSGTSFAALPV